MYSEQEILIFIVNDTTDESFSAYVNPQITIEELKYQIQGELGTLFNDQFLVFNKKPLLSNTQKLSELGIGDKAVINLNVKEMRGPSFQFNNLSNRIATETKKSKTGLRTVYPGLMLEAICDNEKCRAYKKKILVKKGFGSFNIGRQSSECICQICGELTQQAFNMGFFRTKVKIEGKKQGQKQTISMSMETEGQKYHTFKHEGSSDLMKWNFLQVDTSPISK